MKIDNGSLVRVAMLAMCIATLAGCVQPTGAEEASEDVDVEEAPLYGGGSVSTLWTGTIPVCFKQAGASTALKNETRDLVMDNWARVGSVSFSGWGTCAANPTATITVTFSSGTNGSTDILGKSTTAATNVTLISDGSAEQFRYEVLHEFGHALGFAHEQQRPGSTCTQFQPGETRPLPGGNGYNPLDDSSIMSYCATGPGPAAFPVEFSPGDVAGLRAAYKSSTNSPTCQVLSDTYGVIANQTFGFAPASMQTWWTNHSCATSPSSTDSCQKASDLYGIEANATFGFAPAAVQTWWTNSGCNTKPRSSISLCQRASETYGIAAFQSFGTAPSEVQTWWTNNNCRTSPRVQDTCQHLSDFYGIKANVTFGWAPASVQTWWTGHFCYTNPIIANTCQQLSDVFGLSSSDTKAAAPTAARNAWASAGCTTKPKSGNNCQRASDLYGIVANSTFGFAPSEVQTWWTSKGCNTKPVTANTCQVAANRFGIVGGYSFEAAPSDVSTWWTNTGCNTQPRDAAPIPG